MGCGFSAPQAYKPGQADPDSHVIAAGFPEGPNKALVGPLASPSGTMGGPLPIARRSGGFKRSTSNASTASAAAAPAAAAGASHSSAGGFFGALVGTRAGVATAGGGGGSSAGAAGDHHLQVEGRHPSATSGYASNYSNASQPMEPQGVGRTSFASTTGAAEGGHLAVNTSGASFSSRGEDDALKVVALLQELLALSSSLQRQPLAKSMALLLTRLPVDYICLTAVSSNTRTQVQVAAAFSPEAQRLRGTSGSAALGASSTGVGSSSGSNNQVPPRPFRGLSSGPGTQGTVLELNGGPPQPCAGSGGSIEAVVLSREALAMYAGEGPDERLPTDWQHLQRLRDLKAFLAVPILASGGSGQVIGVLSFGNTHHLDWSREWWMPSCQLICGWAAGALPQARAVLRVNFFDLLAQEEDLDQVAALLVRQLPNVLVDEKLNRLEVRLALVSAKCTSAVIFTSPQSLPEDWVARSGLMQVAAAASDASSAAAPAAAAAGSSSVPGGAAGSQGRLPSGGPPLSVQAAGPAPVAAGAAGGAALPGGSEDRSILPEGIILRAADESATSNMELDAVGGSGSSSALPATLSNSGPLAVPRTSGLAVVELGTNNTVLMSALEWGDVMVIKDTVQYFGRNVGLVQDLFAPASISSSSNSSSGRKQQASTLVLLPLIHKSRALGCLYLIASWDINAALGKVLLGEVAQQLATALFKQLLTPGPLQEQWYALLSSDCAGGHKERTLSQSFRMRDTSHDQQQQQQQVPEEEEGAELRRSSSNAAAAAAAAASAQASSGAGGAAPASSGGTAGGPSSSRRSTSELPLQAAAGAPAVPPKYSGLVAVGHSCYGELSYWPELLEFKEDIARGRSTAVYLADYLGQTLAIKVFRYTTPQDSMPASSGGASSSSLGGSGGARDLDLEAAMGCLYRLCHVHHPHVLQHVAVYPLTYEVLQRRSSRDPTDTYLTAMVPRKDRFHRCCAVVTPFCASRCLREAVTRGALYRVLPTSGAHQAHLLQPSQSGSTRTADELAGLAAAGGGMGGGMGAMVGGQVVAQQAIRVPFMPLLRVVLLQIALGMQYLHSHGIVHGELRAENVLLDGCLPGLPQLPLAVVAAHQAALTEAGEGALDLADIDHQLAAAAAAAAAAGAGGSMGGDAAGACSGAGVSSAAGASQAGASYTSSATAALGSTAAAAAGGSWGGLAGTGASAGGMSTGAGGGGGAATSSMAAAGAPGALEGFTLKIKDIGLCSLSTQGRTVTVKKLVGRTRAHAASWLPPECFRGEPLSKSSDVYAFGILMWELYSGQVAFSNLFHTPAKVLQTIICDGVRPAFPRDAPEWYTSLAARCWHPSAKHRPSFRRVVAQLQALEGRLEADWGPGV